MRFTSDDDVIVGVYGGGTIAVGHVIAKRKAESELEMLYQGATKLGVHDAGKARATFTRDGTNRLRMHLDWQWLTGDQSRGHSDWVMVEGT